MLIFHPTESRRLSWPETKAGNSSSVGNDVFTMCLCVHRSTLRNLLCVLALITDGVTAGCVFCIAIRAVLNILFVFYLVRIVN